MMGRHDVLVLERTLYDICLCKDETGFMISESESFGSDGCDGNITLGTDAADTGWGTTNVDCGVNYGGNTGLG